MTVELTDDYYTALVKRARRRSNIIPAIMMLAMTVAFVVLALDKLGIISPALVDKVLGEEQTIYSTPPPVGQQRPPAEDTVFSGSLYRATATPYPSATPWPTEGGEGEGETEEAFWTPAEETAYAATATAFIEVIPTAPAEFVEYTLEQCRDAELVAASPLLQAWCPEGE